MCDMSCDVTCDRDRDVTFDVTLSRVMSHGVTGFPTLVKGAVYDISTKDLK